MCAGISASRHLTSCSGARGSKSTCWGGTAVPQDRGAIEGPSCLRHNCHALVLAHMGEKPRFVDAGAASWMGQYLRGDVGGEQPSTGEWIGNSALLSAWVVSGRDERADWASPSARGAHKTSPRPEA